MRFTHHPRGKEFVFDQTRTYRQGSAWAKPSGFWLSVDDDWRRWCVDDGMEDWIGDTEVEFALLEPERVFTITDAAGLLAFTEDYVGDQDVYRIDWQPLASQYSGIMIAPYIWECRLLTSASGWYYPWDCASACIWDLSVLELIEVRTLTTQQGEPS